MKKVISIIIGLLCVCATYAISYASPYKGSVSRHSTRTMHISGMASMPTASMGSVNGGMMSSGSSSNSQRGVNYSTTGFATCATTIRGGVTTTTTYAAMSQHKVAPRRTPGNSGAPGQPDGCECQWVWDDANNRWVCSICGHSITLDEYLDDGINACECDPCRCPIEWDWSVLAFLSLLSFAYIAYKKRQKMSNFA